MKKKNFNRFPRLPSQRRRPHIRVAKPFLALAAFLAYLLGSAGEVHGRQADINWERVAGIKPNWKVIVLIQNDRGLTLEDLTLLEQSGFRAADRNAALILARKKAIFKTPLRRWMGRRPWPAHLQASLLPRFYLGTTHWQADICITALENDP